MHRGWGIALLGLGSAGLGLMLPLRKRLAPEAAYSVLAATGILLAAGGLLVQDRGTDAENWAAAVIVMAVLTPLHFRVLLGSLRRRPDA